MTFATLQNVCYLLHCVSWIWIVKLKVFYQTYFQLIYYKESIFGFVLFYEQRKYE